MFFSSIFGKWLFKRLSKIAAPLRRWRYLSAALLTSAFSDRRHRKEIFDLKTPGVRLSNCSGKLLFKTQLKYHIGLYIQMIRCQAAAQV